MNDLQKAFNFEGMEVRVFMINDEPWFVAKDVCVVLDIKNTTQALQTLDDDERSMLNIGRQGQVNIVNESGLFTLIFKSKKPEAKRFRKWVTSEILPAIRKTGSYSTQHEIPSTLSGALQLAADLQLEIETIQPRLEYADKLLDAKNAQITSVVAKNLGTNASKLNKFLNFKGIIFKRNGTWLPYAKYEDAGYHEMHPYKVGDDVYYSLRWTQKGIDFISQQWYKHHPRKTQQVQGELFKKVGA